MQDGNSCRWILGSWGNQGFLLCSFLVSELPATSMGCSGNHNGSGSPAGSTAAALSELACRGERSQLEPEGHQA